MGVVESQRDPASVGQANEQRRAAYERGDGNLPCAYLHGRSQKMNFNATTPTPQQGGDLREIKGIKQIESASPSNSQDQFGSNNANLEDSTPARQVRPTIGKLAVTVAAPALSALEPSMQLCECFSPECFRQSGTSSETASRFGICSSSALPIGS
ncbi:hypothetical protein IVB08_34880 [Bradyrhizobium sp. 173]|uniref:hypothetical protein n=1 Tax=Bradyrhizobium sp. 173 TaxID=2782644 RepID=UPI001FF96965|nr:hypothetical protein [Bradyrhizobium sp. 173]MCK1569043.1 hypothetical protein [Bradyrhizobium sp. 173]